MDLKHLNTLEFSKILEQLAQHTLFSASRTLVLALRPTPYLKEAQVRQDETREADHLLSVKPTIGIGGARDVRPLVVRARQGAILVAPELLDIRQTLIEARNLQRIIVRLAEAYPRLADIAQRIEECPGVVNEIGKAIADNGEIKSNASSNLARIRRELEIAHSRLLEKLQRIVNSPQYSHYLQDTLITQREGRYVIPLKAEFKGKIQGVVQDQSASGATLFIEPIATVELNNKWRQLQLAETEEIRKILAGLSEMVGQHERFIKHTVEALAELDLAFAKAKYAEAIAATEPVLFSLKETKSGKSKSSSSQNGDSSASSQPLFSLISARHPLLNPETVVPINVSLPEETRMLVITGPNTGGKTVSLKTVGLLAAMAQSGLYIPAAEGSTLPVFNHIYADIGDEQSIEQSLSTFSSHMTNIVQILNQCDQVSLVILDELGAGTDPIEGSALARAILANLLERRVITFVATHFSELKAYAHTTPGIANASMEFDLESLAPTYRLRLGLPGASNAFAIAQRLGLPGEIINQAQGLVGEDARQVEAMLAEIKAQTEAAHQLRQQAEMERRQAEAYTEKLQHQLDGIESERRDILKSARADARREIKKVREELRELKEKAAALLQAEPAADSLDESGPEIDSPLSVEQIEDQISRLETEVVDRETTPPPPPTRRVRSSGPIEAGDQVFIASFSAVGEVIARQNNQLEVQLGHFRTKVPVDQVELRQKQPEVDQEIEKERAIELPAVESPGMELDLRGQTAEEALLNLDQYLDQAFMAKLPWVRIIHGKGSGVLRQVVRQELSSHPMITSHRPGDEGEGGEGVTVAKLALT